MSAFHPHCASSRSCCLGPGPASSCPLPIVSNRLPLTPFHRRTPPCYRWFNSIVCTSLNHFTVCLRRAEASSLQPSRLFLIHYYSIDVVASRRSPPFLMRLAVHVFACRPFVSMSIGPMGTRRDIRDAMQEWRGILFGLLSILLFTVVIGVIAVRGLLEAGAYPDGFSDFSTGMIIFFSIPTTLNMGIVVCEQAGGNGAVAVSSTARRDIHPMTIPSVITLVGARIVNHQIKSPTVLQSSLFVVRFVCYTHKHSHTHTDTGTHTHSLAHSHTRNTPPLSPSSFLGVTHSCCCAWHRM